MAIEIGGGITIGGGISIGDGGGGGGGTLAIRNLVYIFSVDSSGYGLVVRGWAFKSDKQSAPMESTIQLQFFDAIQTSNTVDGTIAASAYTTIYGIAATNSTSWDSAITDPSFLNTDLNVNAIQFFPGYDYAGSTAVMPTFGTETGGTLLRYSSSSNQGITPYQAYAGYFPPGSLGTYGYSFTTVWFQNYKLDGSQDSAITSFNSP